MSPDTKQAKSFAEAATKLNTLNSSITEPTPILIEQQN